MSMTKDEEDALYQSCHEVLDGLLVVSGDRILSAIRAAYAKGREEGRAERNVLKVHAEAMAKELESIRDLDGYYFMAVTDLVNKYRQEFPAIMEVK